MSQGIDRKVFLGRLLGLAAGLAGSGAAFSKARAGTSPAPFREDLCLDAAERIEEAVGSLTPVEIDKG